MEPILEVFREFLSQWLGRFLWIRTVVVSGEGAKNSLWHQDDQKRSEAYFLPWTCLSAVFLIVSHSVLWWSVSRSDWKHQVLLSVTTLDRKWRFSLMYWKVHIEICEQFALFSSLKSWQKFRQRFNHWKFFNFHWVPLLAMPCNLISQDSRLVRRPRNTWLRTVEEESRLLGKSGRQLKHMSSNRTHLLNRCVWQSNREQVKQY